MIVILAIAFVVVKKQKQAKQRLAKQEIQRQMELIKSEYAEAKKKGVDNSEIERLAAEAKLAFEKGDYVKVNEILKNISGILKNAKDAVSTPQITPPIDLSDKHLQPSDTVYFLDRAWFKNGFYDAAELVKERVKELDFTVLWIGGISDKDTTLGKMIDLNSPGLKELIDTAHKNNLRVMVGFTPGLMSPNKDAFTTYLNWIISTDISQIKKVYDYSIDYDNFREYDGKKFFSVLDNKQKARLEKELGMSYADVAKKVRGKTCVNSEECLKLSTALNYPIIGHIDGDRVYLRNYPSHGWGLATDTSNPDVVKYYADYTKELMDFGFDGVYIDTNADTYDKKLVEGDHSKLKLVEGVRKTIDAANPKGFIITSHNTRCMDYMYAADHSGECPPVFEPYIDSFFNEQLFGKLKFMTLSTGEIPSSMNPNTYGFQGGYLKDMLANKISSADAVDYIRSTTDGVSRLNFIEEWPGIARVNLVFPEKNEAMLAFLLTVKGTPQIVGGEECGFTYPGILRKQYDWETCDKGILDLHAKLLGIRKNHPALQFGDIKNVWKSGDNIYAYSRSYGNETVIVVINFSDKVASVTLNLPFKSGIIISDDLNDEEFTVSDQSSFNISVPSYGSRILTIKK